MGSISKVEGLEKKREEREKRNKALQARKRGMRLLKEIGCTSVFMTKEEWVGESEAEMWAWEGEARRKLLSKGVGFRPTPEEISTDEKKAGVMRAVVSMIRIVRGRLREETLEYRGKGKQAHEATWEEAIGLRNGCFEREPVVGARTVEAWEEVLNRELEEGVATVWKERVAGTAERGGLDGAASTGGTLSRSERPSCKTEAAGEPREGGGASAQGAEEG